MNFKLRPQLNGDIFYYSEDKILQQLETLNLPRELNLDIGKNLFLLSLWQKLPLAVVLFSFDTLANLLQHHEPSDGRLSILNLAYF